MSSENRTSVESAQLIAAFFHEHGYLPTQHTPTTGEHKRLAQSLSYLRRLKAKDSLPHDAEVILDKAHPNWASRAKHDNTKLRGKADAIWQQRTDEFIAWVSQHDRFPRRHADDPTERFLADWLRGQRSNAQRGRFPERAAALDERIPEWRTTLGYPSSPYTTTAAQRIASYIEEHGCLPSLAVANNDSELESLVKTLVYLRHKKRRGRLPEKASSILDAASPGWLDGIADAAEQHWENKATELVHWVMENKKFPHPSAGDRHERKLGAWLNRQRAHAKRNQYPHRFKKLNRRLPGWEHSPRPRKLWG